MKKILLILIFVSLAWSIPSQAEIAFDFDNSNSLSDKDLAIFIAWKQLKNAGVPADQITTGVVLGVADDVLNSVTTVSRLPEASKDNLSSENSAVLDDQDIAFFIAYNQLVYAGVTNFSFSNVETIAGGLITITTSLGKMPGTAVGDSGLTTTVTGIKAN